MPAKVPIHSQAGAAALLVKQAGKKTHLHLGQGKWAHKVQVSLARGRGDFLPLHSMPSPQLGKLLCCCIALPSTTSSILLVVGRARLPGSPAAQAACSDQ